MEIFRRLHGFLRIREPPKIIRLLKLNGCVEILVCLASAESVTKPPTVRFTNHGRHCTIAEPDSIMEVTKALAALQPLYGKGNVEIITREGVRVRGIVRSMKTTQALTTPSVKVERADGQIVKVPFSSISEIIDHNPVVSR